jgi:hypothetical protein
MTDARRQALARILGVVVVTLAAVYALRLAGLAIATREARQAEAALAAEVASQATQVAAIEAATHHAGSDAGVERWAREVKHWARPGDRVLAPVAASPSPRPPPPTPADDTPLERLWRWLGGR